MSTKLYRYDNGDAMPLLGLDAPGIAEAAVAGVAMLGMLGVLVMALAFMILFQPQLKQGTLTSC